MVNILVNNQVVDIMQINVKSLMEREQRLQDLDDRAGNIAFCWDVFPLVC
jgi:hypothetical protein